MFRDNLPKFNEYLAKEAQGNEALTALANRLNVQKDLKVSDGTLYTTKAISGTMTNVFEDSDIAKKGIRDINNRKLKAGQAMLVERMTIKAFQFSVGANVNDAFIASIDWNNLSAYPELMSGDITFKCDKRVLLEDRLLMDFALANYNDSQLMDGTVVLEKPFFLSPEKELELTLNVCPDINPQRYLVKVIFGGLKTIIQG